MRALVVTMEEGTVGELVEFTNGEVVVQWAAGPTISRFADFETLRGTLGSSVAFEPVRVEPLADRLLRARTAAGMSQRGLSREIGVPFSTISRIEAGHNYVFNPVIEDWLEGR